VANDWDASVTTISRFLSESDCLVTTLLLFETSAHAADRVERHGYGARPQPCCTHSAAVNYVSRIRRLTGILMRRVTSVLRAAQSPIDALLSEPVRALLVMWFLHAGIG
jgi:hypothetical protein